eukprot:COSAG02_NODE_4243_length_5593_cov_32.867674_8_plen_142_part_00
MMGKKTGVLVVLAAVAFFGAAQAEGQDESVRQRRQGQAACSAPPHWMRTNSPRSLFQDHRSRCRLAHDELDGWHISGGGGVVGGWCAGAGAGRGLGEGAGGRGLRSSAQRSIVLTALLATFNRHATRAAKLGRSWQGLGPG